MNRPLPETLDETIDRVAASITAVPADPGFSARLAPRLDARGRGVSTWMLAAAAAAAIVLSVLLVTPDRSPRPVEHATASQQPAPAVSSGAGESAAVSAKVATVAPERTTAAPGVNAPLHAPIDHVPAIAALGPVETLDVDDLRLHELHIAPVDVAHLAIETLEVPEIGTTDDPKE